jgi:hypothetical protein
MQNASKAPGFNSPGTSTEGQAFFLMMEGAHRKLLAGPAGFAHDKATLPASDGRCNLTVERFISPPQTIPTGLNHSAQGCRVREATLGKRFKIIFNPNGVASPVDANGFNPFRVIFNCITNPG